MEIKLVAENDPVLRTVASEWDWEVDGSPEELVKEMTRLMFIHGGIGLAAPQCGISKRIFIMGNSDNLIACINPEVVSGAELARDQEGCLSFPDLWLYVERYKTISVRYYNAAGEKVERDFDDLMARVFQHELDHLNATCFDDRVGKLTLERAKEKRKKLRAKRAK